ncbi:MAG: hypothetical protein RLZZ165_96 [Bacteroidota bacterium]
MPRGLPSGQDTGGGRGRMERGAECPAAQGHCSPMQQGTGGWRVSRWRGTGEGDADSLKQWKDAGGSCRGMKMHRGTDFLPCENGRALLSRKSTGQDFSEAHGKGGTGWTEGQRPGTFTRGGVSGSWGNGTGDGIRWRRTAMDSPTEPNGGKGNGLACGRKLPRRSMEVRPASLSSSRGRLSLPVQPCPGIARTGKRRSRASVRGGAS